MVELDLMRNYYALALCILSKVSVDKALRVQGIAPDEGWKKKSEQSKSNDIKNIVPVLMFACGFTKTEVAEMLSVHIQTIGEALVKAGVPIMDYRSRKRTRRKNNG